VPVNLNLPEAAPVKGVELVTLAAGIKPNGTPDMVMVRVAEGSTCSAVFTQSAFCAAPVTVAKEQLAGCDGSVRALLVNSGNANAGTGQLGIDMARGHCAAAAAALSVPENSVLPFSTGVIGQLLPDAVMKAGIAKACDTSTNDACVLVATGASGVTVGREDAAWPDFMGALVQVCKDLAQAIIRDAEGASKFISVHVSGGQTTAECKQVAYSIANSPLVKTAMFASDANVGRLLMAIGKAGVPDLDASRVTVSLGDVTAFEAAGVADGYTEERGAAVMAQDEIDVFVDLARGHETASVYTSDLSHEYVSINADYRS